MIIAYNGEPKLSWLQARLRLDNRGMRKLDQKHQSVLGYCIEDNLESKVGMKNKESQQNDGLRYLV
jgi:hypothetical protein